MSGPWFIETLARSGEVLHRHRLERLPIRLGRAYDNDFILDDAYAAPRHALIDLDSHGKLILHDLGSKNGVVKNGKRLPTLALGGDTVIRIGHTSLRVRAADFSVPAETADRTMHGWEGALPGLAGLLLAAMVALLLTWLFEPGAFRPSAYLQALAAASASAVAWGGAWAFANRLFGRHARLGRHLFIIGSGAAALLLWAAISTLLAYAFALEGFTRYGSHGVIAIAAGIVYFHLATVKPPLRLRFRWLCLLFGVLASGLMLIANLQRSGRMADELYMGVLLPPTLRASPDRTVDAYVDQVEAMKERIDREQGRSADGPE